jgi:hypothetical protein
VIFVQENFILFTVTGLFKEREERSQPLRYFCRTFTLVPQNSGFVIINEMLCITNPTSEQTKVTDKVFKQYFVYSIAPIIFPMYSEVDLNSFFLIE